MATVPGMEVVPIDGCYEIKKAGGTRRAANVRGKINDVLFDGKWLFQVLTGGPVESR